MAKSEENDAMHGLGNAELFGLDHVVLRLEFFAIDHQRSDAVFESIAGGSQVGEDAIKDEHAAVSGRQHALDIFHHKHGRACGARPVRGLPSAQPLTTSRNGNMVPNVGTYATVGP